MRLRSKAQAAAAMSLALAVGPAAFAQLSTAPLAQVDAWGVGWIGTNEGAVPSGFWNNTGAETLGPILASLQPHELSPAAAATLRRILMSRAKGPAGRAELTPERLRLLEQLGETASAIDLRKRYPTTEWGEPGERLGAELDLLKGDTAAACAAMRGQPPTDQDWMGVRAVCAALEGKMDGVNLATEQIARTNESLGVWLIGALPAIADPDIKKPDGRYGTPLEAAVSVAARLSVPAGGLGDMPADLAAAIATNGNASPDQRRAALRPAFNGGKLKPADVTAILALKEDASRTKAPPRGASARPDYLTQALAAANDKDAKAEARATAYASALRSAESLADGRLIAVALSSAIKALPRNDATLPYAEPIARAALLTGDTKLAVDWRKHLGTLPKDKQDAWAAARIDLMLAFGGFNTEKTSVILDRMLEAVPYPDPAAKGPTRPSAGEQQVAIRRIENTRALFLTAGMGRDLTAEQRAILADQRTAGRGVPDSAITRITAAARQDADAEAALAILAQLNGDVSAISFAGLSDLLAQMRAIDLDADAEAITLESLQVWKAL